MKTNEEMNVYVQPECKVYQVQLHKMISTSGENEEYGTGDTSSWY